MKKAVKKTVRTCGTAGVAVVTAATIAFVPSVAQPTTHPTAAPAATVRVVSAPIALTAASQPLSTAALPTLLSDWLERIIVPPSASAPVPTPDLSVAPVATSIDSAIKNTYNAIEPWVRYGFEVATYAVGWVPVVGWLAPQIMIFYNLGERITRSITFNVADFIGGNVSFGQGLRNVARDTVNSFIYFANDELAFWLPPLPPIPPIGPLAASLTTKVTPAASGQEALTTTATDVADTPSGADVPATGADTPGVKTPTRPTNRPFRDGSLTTFVQRITHRDTEAATTSTTVSTLADSSTADQTASDTPARPKPHGLVGAVSSAVRNLVSAATHPLQAKPAKDKDTAGDAGQS